MFHSTYYGIGIYFERNAQNGLRWQCRMGNGRFCADTLAGLRDMIRIDVKK